MSISPAPFVPKAKRLFRWWHGQEQTSFFKTDSIASHWYSVIKSNCHKQYLSEEPKNCKKWSNPMIFRKLLCGGFGILMSQNYQTEKNIAFHWCAKMVGWLHLHSAPHIWYTDAPDKQPWTFLKIYGGAYSVWCCLGMSWGVWGRVLVYFGGILWC